MGREFESPLSRQRKMRFYRGNWLYSLFGLFGVLVLTTAIWLLSGCTLAVLHPLVKLYAPNKMGGQWLLVRREPMRMVGRRSRRISIIITALIK